MENISFEVIIPSYNITVIFLIGDDIFELSKAIKKKHKVRVLRGFSKKVSEGMDGGVFRDFISEGLIYVAIERVNGQISLDTLTHEIFHQTTNILEENRSNFYRDEEEYAQLNGILNSMIIQKLIDCGEELFTEKSKKIIIKNINLC